MNGVQFTPLEEGNMRKLQTFFSTVIGIFQDLRTQAGAYLEKIGQDRSPIRDDLGWITGDEDSEGPPVL
jgi:hypothetical protein